MKQFIANINKEDKIIQMEVEMKTIEDAKEYFNNYFRYWGKVQHEWNSAYIINIKEKCT